MVILTFVALAVVLVWIVAECRRLKTLLPLFILVGGGAACITECLWDVLDCVWYPQIGPAPIYRLFNISVPLWVVGGYSLYIGAQGYWVYNQIANRTLTVRKFWLFYLFAWASDVILELPNLQLGVYAYYGPQPFNFFGFPLWQAMGNAMAPVFIGAVIYYWRDVFTRFGGLLSLIVPAVAMVAALSVVGWPIWVALHSGAGYAATYPAGALSLLLSLAIGYLIAQKICVPQAALSMRTGVSGIVRPGTAI
jgi:hypothetical protein